MTRPVIAFVGTGMMGQLAHLVNYSRLRDDGACTIAGVTDLNRELAEAVAAKYAAGRVYANLEEILADPGVDGVVCIQQWPNNYPLVKLILEAGKSVITEKPMVGRVDQAEALTELAERQGVIYAVGFMKRYDAGVELAKRLVDDKRSSGELGRLLAVDALCDGGDWLHGTEPPIRVDGLIPVRPSLADFPDVCQTPELQAAYGYLVNIFSHNVNLCHYLLATPCEVHAALLRGSQSMSATLRNGDVVISVHGAASAGPEWRERTALTFEAGEIVIKTPTPMNRQRSAEVTMLQRHGDGFVRQQYEAPVGWAFFRQAQGFVQALAGGEPVRAPAQTSLWDVRVMERMIDVAEMVQP